jgi:hypothetical protein
MSDDKYPEDTNRRRFVKGVVGGAALAGVGAAGATTVNTLTNPTGAGGGVTEFYGVENTDGPAPRAMPQIPIDIDEEGYLIGQFPTSGSETIGDIEYKPDWFQYCGLQTYPGVQPVERDTPPTSGSPTSKPAAGCTSTTSPTTRAGATESAIPASASRPGGPGARRTSRPRSGCRSK